MNKTLLSYLLIIGIAGTAGATTGVVGKRVLGQEIVDYSGFNPEDFQDDSAELLSKYESNPNQKFSPTDLVNIGLEKYRRSENCFSIGIGLADTVVKQTIRNYQIKNGDKYFEESISKSSMVGVANRVIQDGKDGDIVLFKGSATGSTTASYPSEGTTYTQKDYKDYLGKTLDEMFIYLISNRSVLPEGNSVEKNGEEVIINLNLNPDIASYYYKFQMKNISGLDGLPSFGYLKQKYTFDKNMNLIALSVDEQYSASMGITVGIRNTIDYKYYTEYKKIPENNEQLDYSIGGNDNGQKEN